MPIKVNSDFTILAGADVAITAVVGDDMLPIRFSIFKAGAHMLLTPGVIVRWTNRDDLSDITTFRMGLQGTFSNY